MGKEKSPPKFNEKQAGATAKFLRIPPRKARFVIDAVRGKYVQDALAVLKFVPNFAARAIEDVIKSAVSNAENGRPHDEESGRPLPALNTDNLKLVRAWVDEGPRIKRVQPRAQGRAYRIVKRMCHISVIVEEVAPKPRPVRRPTAARRPAAAPARPARTAAVATEEKTTVAPPEDTKPITASVAPEEEGSSASPAQQTSAADGADDAPAEKQPDTE